MENTYINNTQITQIGSQEGDGKAYDSLFYDARNKIIYSKSIYSRKHTTVFTTTSKQSDTIYTVAGRDPATIGRMFLLLENIGKLNMIMMVNHKTKRAIPAATKQDLYDIMHLQRAAGGKLIKTLEDKGVIVEITQSLKNETTGKEEKHKRFCISPVYTMAYKGLPLETYLLFKESIDRLLPRKEVVELEKILYMDINGEELKAPIPVIDRTATELDALVDGLSDDKEAIFNEYILHGQAPKTYQLLGKGVVAHELSPDNDTYFLVNRTATYKETKPLKTDIIGYNAWYVDIDCGKNADNKYYSLEEVSRRKKEINNSIDLLPTPTAIIDTRNGYHVYWACSGLDSAEDADTWQQIQNKLHEIVSIADPTGKDSSRILRLPGSRWIKAYTGLSPYDVTIVQAAAIRYTADQFQQQLDSCSDNVQAAAQSYITVYPAVASKSGKIAAAVVPVENQSERVQAIMDLSLDTFTVPDTSTEVNNIKEYLRQQDLADFLQIANPSSFQCILHDDHHPSASIYHNDSGYRYYCAIGSCAGHGDGHGADIIDVVMALSGCRYKQAINYLCALYGIKQKRQDAA